MIETLRSRAALWTGAGILALAGVATSLAAAGTNSTMTEESEPAFGLVSAIQSQLEPEAFVALALEQLAPVANQPANGNGDSEESLVLGVSQESPACENNGCAEVENAGGVTLHLPQPAVDGIIRAAENRAAAQENGNDVEDLDIEEAEDADGGVPADSPACDNVGCAEAETPGGVNLNLPQPAADGMDRAKAYREAAQGNGNGNGNGDDAVQHTANGNATAGRPAGVGRP